VPYRLDQPARAETAARRPPHANTASVRDDIPTPASSAWSISAGARRCSYPDSGALAVFAGWYAAGHLASPLTRTRCFRRACLATARRDVQKSSSAVSGSAGGGVDAREPEQRRTRPPRWPRVWRPTTNISLPFGAPSVSFPEEGGLLFLEASQLESLVDRMIDAQPFLGELSKDPSARGLFEALSLLGTGVEQGQVNLAPYQTALAGFTMRWRMRSPAIRIAVLGAAAGRRAGRARRATNLCWRSPSSTTPSFRRAELRARRYAMLRASSIRKIGGRRVRITGNVALARRGVRLGRARCGGGDDRQLAADLAVVVPGGSHLAVDRSILLTLGLGLMLTLLFAAAAVEPEPGLGRLRHPVCRHRGRLLRSVLRSLSRDAPRLPRAGPSAERDRSAGWGTILVASAATAAGFLSFVPTDSAASRNWG